MGGDRLARRLLEAQVDRGLDGQAAALEQRLALVDGLAERRVAQQVAVGVVAEERRDRRDAAVAGAADREPEALLLDPRGLLVGDLAELGHPVEDDVAARLRDLRVGRRVEPDRVLDQPGEQRRLTQVEVLGVLAEVVAGGGLDAVGAVTEVGDVEVALEDPVLGVVLLERDRVPQLLDLALVGVLGGGLALRGGLGLGEQRHLRHLLGDRGATLDDAAAGLVGEEGAQRALQVESAVLVEAVVLDRDDRGAHDRGDVLELDRAAVLVVERGDRLAAPAQQPGALGQRLGPQLLREVLEPAGRGLAGDTERTGERDRQTTDQEAENCGDRDHHTEVRHHRYRAEAFVIGRGRGVGRHSTRIRERWGTLDRTGRPRLPSHN